MLSRTLKMAFWVCYDHLGKLLAANLLCMLALLFPLGLAWAAVAAGDPAMMLLLGVPMLVLVFGVVLPVEAAAIAHMAKELIDTRDGSLRTFFRGLRLYAGRAIGLGLAYVAAGCCLSTSIWFYAARLGEAVPWFGYAVSALALWCLAFVAFTALLVMPALVQKKEGLWPTLRLSGLLVLDNPLFCIGLAAHAALLAGCSLLPPVLMFFSLAPLIVLVSSGYEMLSRKYAALEAHRALGQTDTPLRIDFKDEEDDYLNRGFRDFFFPWKG